MFWQYNKVRFLIMLVCWIACAKSEISIEPGHLDCTTNNPSVSVSVEKDNRTDKIIFKVRIQEDINVNISKLEAAAVPEISESTERGVIQEMTDTMDWDYFISQNIRPTGINIYHYDVYDEIYDDVTPPEPLIPEFESDESFCEEAKKEDDTRRPIKQQDGTMHPNYMKLPGIGFYRFHSTPRKWEDARRICEKEGAHLAILNSNDEAEALRELHNRCPRILHTHFNDYIYLGLHDTYKEGKFETVYGELLDATGYVKWASNQPDNAHHFGENCLTMNRKGFFNDVPCHTELPYFCEHN